jgi:hypothetical protein
MNDGSLLTAIVTATDVMMPVTLLTIWLILNRARGAAPRPLAFGVVLAAALVWAAAWVWVPALAALRLLPPPAGQAPAIGAVVLAFVALRVLPSVRSYFSSADPQVLVEAGPWRIVYGVALWALGALGGLPVAFYASAGLGDILVGIWSLTILARRPSVSRNELVAWNAVGLADLLHVLVLGAINLGPFYLANPAVPLLNLLPLAGVPAFIGLHILTLTGLLSQKSAKTSVAT